MTGLNLSDADRRALATAGVAEGPDGSLRSASGAAVSPRAAAALIKGDGISPQDYQRPYLTAGHSADSPANGRRGVVPEPPEGGGRSSSLCTTPPDDGGPREGDGVEKVVAAEDFARGYLAAGHAAPSPGDLADNNSVAPVTGSGTEMYRHAAETYNANVARERAGHVMPSQACPAQPATASWSPPADLQANAVPTPVNPSGLAGHAPGER